MLDKGDNRRYNMHRVKYYLHTVQVITLYKMFGREQK